MLHHFGAKDVEIVGSIVGTFCPGKIVLSLITGRK